MRMKLMVVAAVATVGLFVGTGTRAEDAVTNAVPVQQIVKPQTLCPIMGNKIDKKQFADYEGKRVYFCCGMCPATFNKDPAKYVKQLEDQGITLDKAPAAKPKDAKAGAAAPKAGQ